MRTFKFYLWCFSGNRELMERYAQEMNGIVVEKVVLRI